MKTHNAPNISTLLLALVSMLALAALPACGNEADDNNEHGNDAGMTADADGNHGGDGGDSCEKKPPTDPPGHACWHACKETPNEVEAVAPGTAFDQTPEVPFGFTQRITLTDDGNGQKVGTVAFHAGEAAIASGSMKNIHFFTVNDVPVEVTAEGADMPVSMGARNEIDCDQGLKYENVFELESKEYAVQFGPTDRDAVTLVIVPFGGPDG